MMWKQTDSSEGSSSYVTMVTVWLTVGKKLSPVTSSVLCIIPDRKIKLKHLYVIIYAGTFKIKRWAVK